MNALTFPITCPRCGQPVQLTNHGKVAVGELNAVITCTGCRLESGLHIRLIPVTAEDHGGGKHCGTNYGYEAHRRNGTSACDACRRAHAERARDHRLARTNA